MGSDLSGGDEVAELARLMSQSQNTTVQGLLRNLMHKQNNSEAIAELAFLCSTCKNDSVRARLQQCMSFLSGEVSAKSEKLSPASGDSKPKHAPVKEEAPKSSSKQDKAVPKSSPKTAAKQNKPPAAAAAATAPTPIAVTSTNSMQDNLNYTTISTFSWEQTDDEVKVLVPCEGVSKDMVSVNYTSNSFDLKVVGLNGKNFRVAVTPLHAAIDTTQSGFFVPKSQKRVVVKLKKQQTSSYADKHWTELKAKPAPAASKKPMDSNPDDPSAGIMDLMKNLYEEGDDEMKRTIAKAWTESREGKMPEMPEMPEMPKIDPPSFDPNMKLPPMPDFKNMPMPKFP